MSRFLSVLGYLASLLLFVLSAMAFTDSLLAGVLILIAGFLSFPISYRMIRALLPFLNNVLRVILVLTLVIYGMYLVLSLPDTSNEASPSSSEESVSDEPTNSPLVPHVEKALVSDVDLENADLSLLSAYTELGKRNYAGAQSTAQDIIDTFQDVYSSDGVSGPLKERILLRHRQALLVYKTSFLLQEKDTLFDSLENANISELLPKLEILSRGYRENSSGWAELISSLQSVPDSGYDADFIDTVAQIAQVQDLFADMIDQNITRLSGNIVNYVSVKSRIIPSLAKETTRFTGDQGLADFFSKFDRDKSESLSMEEAQDFYYWVENNITYRYDDEAETNPFVGMLVGDGRDGSDYRQTPTETLQERAGDCEDNSTLEQAFYQYFGIDAYVVAVNSSSPSDPDHAATIVRISGHLDEFKKALGEIFYYEVSDGEVDMYGSPIPAGVYMLVDNAYSAAFGYVSGGVDAGFFQIFCYIPLEKGYGDEWRKLVNQCGVPMN